jgi:homoserine dehydrogenase
VRCFHPRALQDTRACFVGAVVLAYVRFPGFGFLLRYVGRGCYYGRIMEQVNVGIIGLGNIGSGTMTVFAENAEQIDLKLGFRLRVKAICDLRIEQMTIPDGLGPVLKTTDWRQVVTHPDVNIVVELVGGTKVAAEVIEAAFANGKSVVTANKELMGLCGADLWERAIAAGVNIAMEASVAGGIPIHAVLREGISGDRIVALYGILNGTSNYILTEMEKHGTPLETVLAEAQRLGYAEANPTNDIDGFDPRSKLALLAALAFGERITPSDIYTEGIRRIAPIDFDYAHRLGHTIRLLCAARQNQEGLVLSVRPALISEKTILAGVRGSYNAVWVKGLYGEDTFYYGRGAGSRPTAVAVVSDLMRVAREIRDGSPERVSPFAHKRLGEYKPIPLAQQKRAFYLRFRVADRVGIISSLANILASKHIGLDAVLQVPCENKRDLPFVITLEETAEQAVREAVAEMEKMDFLLEPPLALPIEPSL